MSFVCGKKAEDVIHELKYTIPTEGFQPHLLRSRLPLSVLQLLGVLLPDGEDPIVAAEVVAARSLSVLFSDWTDMKEILQMYSVVFPRRCESYGTVEKKKIEVRKADLTSRTRQNWTRWFWTALPSTSCTCPPAQLSRRSSSHGEQSVYASAALSQLASVGSRTCDTGEWDGESWVGGVCKRGTPLTKLGSLLRQASTNSLSGLL